MFAGCPPPADPALVVAAERYDVNDVTGQVYAANLSAYIHFRESMKCVSTLIQNSLYAVPAAGGTTVAPAGAACQALATAASGLVASSNTNTTFILSLATNKAKFNTIVAMGVATGSCVGSAATAALNAAMADITAVLAVQRSILNTIDIKLKQPIPYCDVYYSTTASPTTTVTTTTGTQTTTKTTTTTPMTTTTYGLLTIPVCLERPVNSSSSNATKAVTAAAGRRRRDAALYEAAPRDAALYEAAPRDVALYEAPRRYKREIMTVCDPRQVFGAQITALDADHFQVIF
jgi:hypothetical protein